MSHLQTNCCLKPYSQEQNGQIIQGRGSRHQTPQGQSLAKYETMQ